MANIYSIGSLNMDIVLHVAELPKPGETLHSLSRKHFSGGRGRIKRSLPLGAAVLLP